MKRDRSHALAFRFADFLWALARCRQRPLEDEQCVWRRRGIAGSPAASRSAVPNFRKFCAHIVWSFATLAVTGNAVAQDVAQSPSTVPLVVITRPYDLRELLTRPAVSQAAQKGRILWLQRCAFCHDGVGQPTYRTMGPWLGAETVQNLGADALRAIIGAGTVRMPGFRYDLLPQQVDQLIEFLKTVGPEQKPTAAQLAGKSTGAIVAKGDE